MGLLPDNFKLKFAQIKKVIIFAIIFNQFSQKSLLTIIMFARNYILSVNKKTKIQFYPPPFNIC